MSMFRSCRASFDDLNGVRKEVPHAPIPLHRSATLLIAFASLWVMASGCDRSRPVKPVVAKPEDLSVELPTPRRSLRENLKLKGKPK